MILVKGKIIMTTQQNNILINLMLNGELVKNCGKINDTIMVCVYRNEEFNYIYLDEEGRE